MKKPFKMITVLLITLQKEFIVFRDSLFQIAIIDDRIFDRWYKVHMDKIPTNVKHCLTSD